MVREFFKKVMVVIALGAYIAPANAAQNSNITPQDEQVLSQLAKAAEQSLTLFSQVTTKEELEQRKQEISQVISQLQSKYPQEPRIQTIQKALDGAYSFMSQQISAKAPAAPMTTAVTTTTAPLKMPPATSQVNLAKHPAQQQPSPDSKAIAQLKEFITMPPQQIVEFARKQNIDQATLENRLATLRASASTPQDIHIIEEAQGKIKDAFAVTSQAQAPQATQTSKSVGLSEKQRAQLKDFITLARQGLNEIFSDLRSMDAEHIKLENVIKDLKKVAYNNKEDTELLANVSMWLEKAYQQGLKYLHRAQSLSADQIKTLRKVISSTPQEIFNTALIADPSFKDAALEAAVQLWRTTLEEWEKETTQPSDKNLTQQARQKIDPAYKATKRDIEAALAKKAEPIRTNPIVGAIIDSSEATITEDSQEAPPMEEGPAAPTMHDGYALPPETLPTPTTLSPLPETSKLKRPAPAGRADLLADIRKGKKLQPINPQGQQTSSPRKEHTARSAGKAGAPSPQESLQETLKTKLAQRRKGIKGG